jgi:hypothetical protein
MNLLDTSNFPPAPHRRRAMEQAMKEQQGALAFADAPAGSEAPHHLQELEIDTGKRKRIAGWVAYVLFFAVVAGLLVFVFLQFTPSVMLATGLVTFMILYMSVMGWITSRSLGKQDYRRDF